MKVIAIARCAEHSQKRRRCRLSTGIAWRTRKPVISAAVCFRPSRFIAWPTVWTGCPTANSGPFALRISVAAIATSLAAMRATSLRSGSASAIAACSRASSAGQGGTTMCCSGPRVRA